MVSAQELADYNAKFKAGATFGAAALTNFPFDLVLRRGDLVPEFSLPGSTGETTSLLETLAGGPVVLTFYRAFGAPIVTSSSQLTSVLCRILLKLADVSLHSRRKSRMVPCR